ncbi:hypothetical protein QE152_g7613 [Popillia japonica]|uniref:Uncharacterized protein n=1 Tax=Popillia japonica TaxID=7064 RepID=A0AAW1ME50_POPJA
MFLLAQTKLLCVCDINHAHDIEKGVKLKLFYLRRVGLHAATASKNRRQEQPNRTHLNSSRFRSHLGVSTYLGYADTFGQSADKESRAHGFYLFCEVSVGLVQDTIYRNITRMEAD